MTLDEARAQYQPILPADGRERSKVCIVGFAGSTRDQFPRGDPDLEIWGMNRLMEVPGFDTSPFTRWFQIHPRRWWDTEKRKKEVQWMRACGIPLYLHEHYDDIPASVPYPRKLVEQAFNQYLPALPDGQYRLDDGEPYHTTSVTWMIALALLEGFKEIHVYGVDMVTDEEYGYQRPACEFWLGLAAGLGIRTVIPKDSALCTQEWLYGWELPGEQQGVIGDKLLNDRRKIVTSKRDEAMAHANFCAGSLAELDHLTAILKHAGRGGKTGQKAAAEMAAVAMKSPAARPQPMVAQQTAAQG